MSRRRKPAPAEYGPAGRPEDPRSNAARTRLHLFIAMHGKQFARVEQAPLQGPFGDCWTNAYAYAQQHGYGYAEGQVIHSSGAVHAHAWAVGPLGQAVEATVGYDGATDYHGVIIDLSKRVPAITADWGQSLAEPRSSIIEAVIAAGAAPADIKRDVCL